MSKAKTRTAAAAGTVPPLSTAARLSLVFIAGVMLGRSGITPEAAVGFIFYYWETIVTIGALLTFTSSTTGEKFQQLIEHPKIKELAAKLKKARVKK